MLQIKEFSSERQNVCRVRRTGLQVRERIARCVSKTSKERITAEPLQDGAILETSSGTLPQGKGFLAEEPRAPSVLC